MINMTMHTQFGFEKPDVRMHLHIMYKYIYKYIYMYLYYISMIYQNHLKKHHHFGSVNTHHNVYIYCHFFFPKAGVRIAARRIETWCKGERRGDLESTGSTALFRGIVGCTPGATYPYRKSLYKPYNYTGYLWVSYPQESLENAISTMGTRTLGVHPIVP